MIRDLLTGAVFLGFAIVAVGVAWFFTKWLERPKVNPWDEEEL